MSDDNNGANGADEVLKVRDRMRHMAADADRGSLGKVCIKDGCAYVTDGRIAARWRIATPGGCEDDVPDNYPVDSLLKILKEVDSVKGWHKMRMADYKAAEKPFLEEYKKERASSESAHMRRYKYTTCPSCGEDLYWDSWSDQLVSEDGLEIGPPLKPHECQFPVVLAFGDGGEKTLVNFGYLLTIVMAMGEDMLFGMSNPTDESTRKLVFRSQDGILGGVLMPLRIEGGGDMEGMHEIVMDRV